MLDNSSQGMLYIILGILLLLLFVGQWMLQLFMVLLALYLISKGLSMRGMPGMRVFIIRCLDKTKNYY